MTLGPTPLVTAHTGWIQTLAQPTQHSPKHYPLLSYTNRDMTQGCVSSFLLFIVQGREWLIHRRRKVEKKGEKMRGSDGTAAKLRDDRAAAARGTIAAALAYKRAVVVSGVAVERQAAAGTRAGCGVRERAPPGFQERGRRLGRITRRAGEALSLSTRPLLVGLRQEDARS